MFSSGSDFIFLLFFGAVARSGFAIWLYALISAIQNERLDSTMKLVWVLVIVFVSFLGAVIYLVVAPGRPSRREIKNEQWRRHSRRVARIVPRTPGTD